MIRFSLSLLLLSTLLFSGCSKPSQETISANSGDRPNIIYILADDLGWGDISHLGQKTLKTPNIDRLAVEGMTLTQHYAGAPVCGPSRAVLLTGQHTGRTEIRGNKAIKGIGVAPLSPDFLTLPEAIKQNTDYTTAMSGRWHLGGELSDQMPHQRGFDYHFGKLSSNYPNKVGVMIDHLWDEKGKHVPYEMYSKANTEPMYENGELFNLAEIDQAMRPINMDELVTDKAVRYITQKREKPFFLYVAYSMVHAPMEYHAKYPVPENDWPENERAFASMLQALDAYVGQILQATKDAGIDENTLIIFASDNGAHNEDHDVEFFDSNGPYREYKRSFYDGGFLSPTFARWPNTIKAGSTSDHLSAFWDVMPTLCDIAGAPIPDQTDGISFLPTLKGETQIPHEFLYWEFNEDIYKKKGNYKQAVRLKDWKGIYYINDDRFELFNVHTDISEENNVAEQHPEVVKTIKRIMEREHTPSERFPLLKSERSDA
ncbi:MAG: arylsulfatase [Verrucomicrobiota bacterium]